MGMDVGIHSGSADWLIPTFRNFDYPGFVAAPWIAEHLPFISHGDIGPTMTEVRTCDGIYILISGVLWFAIGAIIIVAFHRLRESKTSSISAK
jgi:hypothetical protein